MKEASGELSMTAITVVAIATIAGVFTMVIYPRIKANIIMQTKCANKFNCDCSGSGDMCNCKVANEDGTVEEIECPMAQ